MRDLTDLIAELSLERQLEVNRAMASMSADAVGLLLELRVEIERKLADEGKELTDFRRDRLERLLREVMDMVGMRYDAVRESLQPDLLELAGQEAQWVKLAVNDALQVNLLRVLPSSAAIEEIVSKGLFDGAPLEAWFKKQADDTKLKIEREIRMGVAQGETNAEIVRRIAGSKRLGQEGVLKISTKNAQTLVLTAAQTVSQRASMLTYEANDDILEGWVQSSTLDGRTTDICIAYSGKKWDKDKKPVGHSLPYGMGCPRHPRCRSRILPRTKTFRQLGLDIDDFKPSTRASMDGPVAADMTFEQFLEKKGKAFTEQVLGPGRAALYRSGKITLGQLLDQSGNPLTLQELRAKYEK